MLEYLMLILRFIILVLLLTQGYAFTGEPISEKTMQKANKKYGGKIVLRYTKYNKLLLRIEHFDERNKLKAVNKFFNKVPFAQDIKNWKQEDYWATPLEFLARGKGDSEDYVIAKYFALTTSGIDPKKLYFTYVNSKKLQGPHMVLSYFETPESEPYILDNFTPDIQSASNRTDLTPVFNFSPSLSKEFKDTDTQQGSHKKWEKLYKRVQRNKL